MTIEFQRHKETSTFLDGGGALLEKPTEIRFDPLTGETSRIVPNPGIHGSAPHTREEFEAAGGANCLFCEENMERVTPIFTHEVAPEGRITKGTAVVFPNLFPYGKHNAVVIFSQSHVVDLTEMSASTIADAFGAAQEYLQRIKKVDPTAKYASVNWNYLPESGGSIFHPHVQVLLSEVPTNYQHKFMDKNSAYKGTEGSDYLLDLCALEEQVGERWIGKHGAVSWVHAFAPKSHNDFLGVFSQAFSLADVSEQDWLDFATGLQAILAAMREEEFFSFNLSLHVPMTSEQKFPVHVRVIPRLTYGGIRTSEINFLQALHEENLSYLVPEEVAKLARHHFGQIVAQK